LWQVAHERPLPPGNGQLRLTFRLLLPFDAGPRLAEAGSGDDDEGHGARPDRVHRTQNLTRTAQPNHEP
jgi:hypothetical protein